MESVCYVLCNLLLYYLQLREKIKMKMKTIVKSKIKSNQTNQILNAIKTA